MAAYVLVAVQALLAVVFGVSVVTKVRSRQAFREFTSTVRVLLGSRRAAPAAAAGVVLAEAAIVPLVLLPATAPAGLALAAGLTVAFVAVTLVALRRRLTAPCRCFGGVSSTPLGRVHLVRNALLLATVLAAALALLLGAGDGAADVAGVLVALAGGAVAGVLLIFLDEVLSLFGPTIVGGGHATQRR